MSRSVINPTLYLKISSQPEYGLHHYLSLWILFIPLSCLLGSCIPWFYPLHLALHVSLINIVILCGEETSVEISPSHPIANKRMKERTLCFSSSLPAGELTLHHSSLESSSTVMRSPGLKHKHTHTHLAHLTRFTSDTNKWRMMLMTAWMLWPNWKFNKYVNRLTGSPGHLSRWL